MLSENCCVLIGTGLCPVGTGFGLVGTGFGLVGAFAFGLYSELYFLFPRHISLLCFLVRLVPYDLRVYPLCLCVRFLRPVRGEVFQILFKRMLVVEFIVIRIYKKILICSVAQFEAAVFLRNIPKAVYRKFLAENVFWADKYDVLIFKIVVEAALVQVVGIAHALVIAGAPRQVLGVGHLHLDVERTKFLPVLAELLGEHVVADAFVEGADLDRLLLDGFAEIVNFEAECSLDERLRDVLVAEHQGEHEAVGDGDLGEIEGLASIAELRDIFHIIASWNATGAAARNALHL